MCRHCSWGVGEGRCVVQPTPLCLCSCCEEGHGWGSPDGRPCLCCCCGLCCFMLCLILVHVLSASVALSADVCCNGMLVSQAGVAVGELSNAIYRLLNWYTVDVVHPVHLLAYARCHGDGCAIWLHVAVMRCLKRWLSLLGLSTLYPHCAHVHDLAAVLRWARLFKHCCGVMFCWQLQYKLLVRLPSKKCPAVTKMVTNRSVGSAGAVPAGHLPGHILLVSFVSASFFST